MKKKYEKPAGDFVMFEKDMILTNSTADSGFDLDDEDVLDGEVVQENQGDNPQATNFTIP